AADAKRQTIPWVEYRNENTGAVRTYVAAESQADDAARLPMHEMQCVDCHNRPAHAFELPERALNRAMVSGEIPPTLPFAKKIGLELLQTDYPDQEDAVRKIAGGFRNYYRDSHPGVFEQQTAQIEKAATALSA